jgi:methionine aminopeptidase
MREAGRVVADVLTELAAHVAPGVTTADLDAMAEKRIAKAGAEPAFKGYHGYPATICASINEEVIHGIPSGRALREGDIINIDITHVYRGFHGDTSATFYVGRPSEEAKLVTEVARRSLALGIAEVRPGARLGDIGAAIGLECQLRLNAFPQLIVADRGKRLWRRRMRILQRRNLFVAKRLQLLGRSGVVAVTVDNQVEKWKSRKVEADLQKSRGRPSGRPFSSA